MDFWKNNKTFLLYFFIGLLFFIISVCYIMTFIPVFGDEIWNFGFSSNISKGMVIYRDFNVLQGPLYFFVGSIFVKIFGNYLLSLSLFSSLLIVGMMVMLFKLIKYKSLCVYPFILLSAVSSYNLLCLFFLILIIYILSLDKKYDCLIAFIVGLCLITKQNIGVCLFIPTLFYSKNKVKTIIMFLIPLMLVSIYMLLNNGFYQFIDYCFLGLFDFGNKNGYFTVIIYFEIVIILFLVFKFIRSRDKELFYILLFQLMVYPICDWYHFLVAFCPVVYYFLKQFNSMFLNAGLIFTFFYIFICTYFGIDICLNNNSFFYLRNVNNIDFNVYDDDCDLILKYKDYSDYYFFIFENAYLYKLYLDEDITKYDLILNGNMGYKGEFRLIDSMDSVCKSNKCVFFVEKYAFDGIYSQINKDIFDYVINNYDKIDGNDGIDVYGNI